MIRFPSFSLDAPPPADGLRHSSLTDWVSVESTYALFEHQARTRPNRPALTQIETGTDDETPRSLNYAEFHAMIARSGNVLLSCGARRGETVGLLLRNRTAVKFPVGARTPRQPVDGREWQGACRPGPNTWR
jgi:hypothetical protein